ncbi:lytic transglycosylase domain-containing protein [Oricola nitratireducens]|uniref:lytic transglycosylase domain-containing protein n=1 Tax=Oricola nitratireducens TaxID=2775868 RepID=UPI0018680271|nr:lytic transglycosylase domain-containing protein [Oricola nitratireducens]
MRSIRTVSALFGAFALAGVSGCTTSGGSDTTAFGPVQEAPADTAAAEAQDPMDALISRYSDEYDVPENLVHRVVKRESTYNPQAKNGGHYGLMQIKPETARTMGYSGSATGLYDAETNLKYGVKYLRGAWLLADGSEDRAVRLYSSGYYYEAKRRGMLEETGLRAD